MLLKDNDNLFSNFPLQTGNWFKSCTHSECTLHQLSPYIGKLKSSIARDLISAFSKPGDLVVDPFSGSGTVPLEAALLGRRVLAADISPYAKILTKAKLSAPHRLQDALHEANKLLAVAETQPAPNLENVPDWIREFSRILSPTAPKRCLEIRLCIKGRK